jgi:signal transduction histidine kinase
MGISGQKVLVVDDMKTNYLYLSKILHQHGYETLFEMDPLQVVNVASLEQPSVILLDFEMPALSGPEVCRQLKTNPQTREIPVLFVTSHTGEAEIAEAFSAGADDYVLKPPREKEIVSRLNRVFLNLELQGKIQSQFEEQAHLTRILSHDINNLLTLSLMGVQGMEKVARKAGIADDAAFQKEFQRALGGTKRIVSLVANVRELQSLEDQKLQLKLVPVTLHEVFDECADLFSEKLTSKGIQLEVECDSTLKVMADPVSLSNSVINNLVSNALKFSFPGGKITLKAEIVQDQIRVEVRDQGLGMNEALLSKIFLKDEQTSRPGTDNEKGTGFGMPIVKRYMELYGGSIQIQSTPRDQSPNSGTLIRLVFQPSS